MGTIIGLTGQMQAGKDTAGNYLVDLYQYERKAFADKLKDAAAALLGISFEEVNLYKMDNLVRVVLEKQNEYMESGETLVSLTFREFLQRFGTEMARETFWYDFWVDLLFDSLDESKDYAITDVRFENEARRIKEKGGYVIHIMRPETDKPADHASEVLLPYNLIDITIRNTRGVADLCKAVDASLYSLGILEW